MKVFLIATAIFLSVFKCFAQKTIDLNNWKFATGDNPEWAKPGFDDSGWKPIKVGKKWEEQGYKDYDGYAWYRIKFNLPANLKRESPLKDSLLFVLGKIDDCDQIFLNGKLLGQNTITVPFNDKPPTTDFSKMAGLWNTNRTYTISANDPRLFWGKENLLAVRVFDISGDGGMLSQPINARMQELGDYLTLDPDSKPLQTMPDGTLSKTMILKRNTSKEIRGELKLEITKVGSKQVIASHTWNVNLRKDTAAFTIGFKGDRFVPMKVACTFTESISKAKLVCTREPECSGNWVKYENNPILGKDTISLYDGCVLRNEAGLFQMYFTWYEKFGFATSQSKDGLRWTAPVACFSYSYDPLAWEQDISSPFVIIKDGLYRMWYTGLIWNSNAEAKSFIGYAESNDGKKWTRKSAGPVLSPDAAWEKGTVSCSHVIWDEQEKLYKMWYSGGDKFEPDAIGYATSKDGIKWKKDNQNPIFKNERQIPWEKERVSVAQVIKRENDYLMFYTGHSENGQAQIGMARSEDGIAHWERYKENPLIKTSSINTNWDSKAVYKPHVIADPENSRWLLYYNGRSIVHPDKDQEQIGIAVYQGLDLGF